jgi:hypothetical protein
VVVSLNAFLASALYGGEWSFSRAGGFTLRKEPTIPGREEVGWLREKNTIVTPAGNRTNVQIREHSNVYMRKAFFMAARNVMSYSHHFHKNVSMVQRSPPGKLIVAQLVKKFPVFYVIVFTRATRWILS